MDVAEAGWMRRYGQNSHVIVQSVIRRQRLVTTLHKRVADKVKLVSLGKSSAGVPPGDPNWKVKAIEES